MEFIEIQEGLCVRCDDIKVIEKFDEFHCKVVTDVGVFDANFPYDTLVSILEQDGQKPDDDRQVAMLKELSQKVGNIGTFAG